MEVGKLIHFIEDRVNLWPLTEIAMPLLTETWPPRIRVRGARHRDQHRKAGGPLFVSTTLAISVSGDTSSRWQLPPRGRTPPSPPAFGYSSAPAALASRQTAAGGR